MKALLAFRLPPIAVTAPNSDSLIRVRGIGRLAGFAPIGIAEGEREFLCMAPTCTTVEFKMLSFCLVFSITTSPPPSPCEGYTTFNCFGSKNNRSVLPFLQFFETFPGINLIIIQPQFSKPLLLPRRSNNVNL